jgi:nucleoside-diphosphate-sugar epimerase
LQAFAENNGRRFLFAGSGSEYGNGYSIGEKAGGCIEGISDAPADLYGTCKYAFGSIAKQVAADMGFEYVHPRIFSLYGPGESNLHGAAAAAAEAFLSLQSFECKAPNNVWDYVYIDDAAHMLAELAAGTFAGVVNISGTQIRMGDLFSLIAEAAGRPDLLIIENAEKAGSAHVGNKDRMNDVFGNPRPTPVEQGVKAAVEWRRKYLAGEFV